MQHTVIGTGPVGFAAAGLALLRDDVLGRLKLPADAEVSVEVPAFAVIAGDVYNAFLRRNRIESSDFAGLSDRQIARRFIEAELPDELTGALEELPKSLEGPLIVRPSSVLEATLERSLGDVYAAKLIPNQEGTDPVQRRRQFGDAVKLVWASAHFADAVSWRLGAGQSAEEQMAVVVQRAVGSRHGNRFYPTVSVVARSYNHYPAPGNEPGEGVVTLALGLGKVIAEGHAWSISPERPTAPPPFKGINDMLKHTQTSFWALDLGGDQGSRAGREDDYLFRLGLGDAEADGTLALLASAYDPESDQLREGLAGSGPRVVTFAPLLRSRSIPFIAVIREVMDHARSATGREVEIELAVTLDPVAGIPVRFGLVQLKTMPGPAEIESLGRDDLRGAGVIAASVDCLGNGARSDLRDVVYLKPGAFDRNQTRTMAAEFDAVNRGLLDDRQSAIFIGYGRWGTTDDRYGVPVRWGQISSAQVIVEVTLPDAPLDLSQGTHFFHHLLSQKVLYLSVEHDGPTEVDLGLLETEEPVWEGRYVRHVRLDRPIEVVVDGASRRGVVRFVAE